MCVVMVNLKLIIIHKMHKNSGLALNRFITDSYKFQRSVNYVIMHCLKFVTDINKQKLTLAFVTTDEKVSIVSMSKAKLASTILF